MRAELLASGDGEPGRHSPKATSEARGRAANLHALVAFLFLSVTIWSKDTEDCSRVRCGRRTGHTDLPHLLTNDTYQRHATGPGLPTRQANAQSGPLARLSEDRLQKDPSAIR